LIISAAAATLPVFAAAASADAMPLSFREIRRAPRFSFAVSAAASSFSSLLRPAFCHAPPPRRSVTPLFVLP